MYVEFNIITLNSKQQVYMEAYFFTMHHPRHKCSNFGNFLLARHNAFNYFLSTFRHFLYQTRSWKQVHLQTNHVLHCPSPNLPSLY